MAPKFIIIGTKKPLHQRIKKQKIITSPFSPNSYDSFLDDDEYYGNIENYYNKHYGNLKFLDWPDMD